MGEDPGLLFAHLLAAFAPVHYLTESPCREAGPAPRKRREFGEADAGNAASCDVLAPPKDGTDSVSVALLRNVVEFLTNGGGEMGKDTDNFLPGGKGMLVHDWGR